MIRPTLNLPTLNLSHLITSWFSLPKCEDYSNNIVEFNFNIFRGQQGEKQGQLQIIDFRPLIIFSTGPVYYNILVSHISIKFFIAR